MHPLYHAAAGIPAVLGGCIPPFHAIARGRAGPHLLAEITVDKFGLHLPLTRQSTVFAQEGVNLDVSTLCDWMGAVAVATQPLSALIAEHVMRAERLHADDTPVPVLAKDKTKTGRLWTVVRDDRPFAGADPPAAVYFYSPDRKGKHPQDFLKSYSGILQADAYSGFGQLYQMWSKTTLALSRRGLETGRRS